MYDQTLDGKELTPKVGLRSRSGGFASSTLAQDPTYSRFFAPGAPHIPQFESTGFGEGGSENDENDDYVSMDEETMTQGAQPRLSLLSVAELTLGRRQEAIVEPTMGGGW